MVCKKCRKILPRGFIEYEPTEICRCAPAGGPKKITQCNFYFGGFDGGHRCEKQRGHKGEHEWHSHRLRESEQKGAGGLLK
jgi:hypothetical protein